MDKTNKMTKIDKDQYIWAEKYRPQTIDDIILPEKVRKKISKWIKEDKEIPNLGFWGDTPGTGKTSLVNAIIKDLDADYVWINASKENGMDILRSKIQTFASTSSIHGKHKIVVLDEADALTQQMQQGIRGVIEEFIGNCRFIFTGNYKDKILEPVRNRLQQIDFDYINNTDLFKKDIGVQIFNRLKFILEEEDIEYTNDSIKIIISNFYPSIREMVLFMQESISDGKLEVEESFIEKMNSFSTITNDMVKRDFYAARKSIMMISDQGAFYTYLYKNMDKLVQKESHVVFTQIVAAYHDMHTRGRDKVIPLAACLAAIINNVNIKFVDEK